MNTALGHWIEVASISKHIWETFWCPDETEVESDHNELCRHYACLVNFYSEPDDDHDQDNKQDNHPNQESCLLFSCCMEVVPLLNVPFGDPNNNVAFHPVYPLLCRWMNNLSSDASKRIGVCYMAKNNILDSIYTKMTSAIAFPRINLTLGFSKKVIDEADDLIVEARIICLVSCSQQSAEFTTFSSKEAVFESDSQENMQQMLNDASIDIKQSLEGRIVSKNNVVILDNTTLLGELNLKLSELYDTHVETLALKDTRVYDSAEYVVLQIEILFSQSDMQISTARLGMVKSFDLRLTVELMRNSNESTNLKNEHDSIIMAESYFNMNHRSPPGYEDLFQELLSLFQIKFRKAVPSAMILVGCAGVGKSTMVSDRFQFFCLTQILLIFMIIVKRDIC